VSPGRGCYARGSVSCPRPLLFALALASITCLREPGFVCEESAQCVAAKDGVCTDLGWCAYPDVTCESGLRFGDSAPEDAAGIWVGDVEDEPPVSLCGNGVVDELESCDDRNREPDDSCHPQCVEPGTVLWTVRWDGEAHSEDKAFGLAIDPANESFYVSGFTTSIVSEKQDILLQRRWIETGGLVWSRSHAGDAHGDDSGENVAVDSDGNAIVTGVEITNAGGADMWLRAYATDGEELWTTRHDDAGGIERGDGVAITASGEIVVVGSAGIDRGGGMIDADIWMARYDRSGTPLGAPTRTVPVRHDQPPPQRRVRLLTRSGQNPLTHRA